MEHRFTLPRIKAFLDANRLTVLGVEASAKVHQQFIETHPETAARTDLECWDAFEQAHPRAFQGMYYFWVRSTSLAVLVWLQQAPPLVRMTRIMVCATLLSA